MGLEGKASHSETMVRNAMNPGKVAGPKHHYDALRLAQTNVLAVGTESVIGLSMARCTQNDQATRSHLIVIDTTGSRAMLCTMTGFVVVDVCSQPASGFSYLHSTAGPRVVVSRANRQVPAGLNLRQATSTGVNALSNVARKVPILSHLAAQNFQTPHFREALPLPNLACPSPPAKVPTHFLSLVDHSRTERAAAVSTCQVDAGDKGGTNTSGTSAHPPDAKHQPLRLNVAPHHVR